MIVIATILQYSWRAYREVGKLMFLAHLLLREGMIYFLSVPSNDREITHVIRNLTLF